VKLANDTEYGLVAGIRTRDLARAFRVSAALEAGQVFVNQWYAPIEAPFGGYKQSGHGREKGVETLSDYTQVKSVVMNLK
jgi:aldehyde dehydrogenase (NAD+)